MRSKKDLAEKFQDWVFEEVLPSIRKQGEYKANQLALEFQEKLRITEEEKTKMIEEKSKLAEKLQEKSVELERAKRKALRINKFVNNVEVRDKKEEWIYVASTDAYQLESLFKIGSTTRLHSRISAYGTGRCEDFYYIWVKKCYKSADLDSHIQHLLRDFKYKSKKELYHGIAFEDLVEILTYVCDNYDKSLEFLYRFVREKLSKGFDREPVVHPPLDIKSITYTIGDHTETVDISCDSREIQQKLFEFFEGINTGEVVKRKDVIQTVSTQGLNSVQLWSAVKKLLNWQSGKSPVVLKDKYFYVEY